MQEEELADGYPNCKYRDILVDSIDQAIYISIIKLVYRSLNCICVPDLKALVLVQILTAKGACSQIFEVLCADLRGGELSSGYTI